MRSRTTGVSDSRPIGIFDSGVGGLTVLRAVSRRLPAESLVYFGDCARVPYGTKSAETIVRYSLEAADYLLRRDVKMLVVACNTATAAALPALVAQLSIPVVGVVEPGAIAAVRATRGKVGVIATEGTVRSGAYRVAIQRIDPSIEVIESACPLFVPLAEEGWANTRVAREVAEVYLKPLMDAGIDTLVLGCTHYPILRATIEHVVGDAISIVDSAETTADTVAQRLADADAAGNGAARDCHFLVTDAADRFKRIAAEFLEHEIERLELVSVG